MTQPDKRGAYATADGKPRIQPSVVAFLDILGFAEQIKAADKQGRSNELLQRLTTLLEDWSGHSGTLRDQSSESDQRSWEVKTFTDNVVVAHPLYYDDDNGEAELGRFKSSLSLLQIAFAFDGFFVRGGIAVGDVYVDDTLIYGKALLDAYEAAEKKADWPRIVFAPSAIEYLHKHLRYYGSVSSAPHNRHVFIDNDDQWVLDYLGDVWQDRTEPPLFNWLEKHRDVVARKLAEFERNPKILAKYQWVARYHNYVCGRLPACDGYALKLSLPPFFARRLEDDPEVLRRHGHGRSNARPRQVPSAGR